MACHEQEGSTGKRRPLASSGAGARTSFATLRTSSLLTFGQVLVRADIEMACHEQEKKPARSQQAFRVEWCRSPDSNRDTRKGGGF